MDKSIWIDEYLANIEVIQRAARVRESVAMLAPKLAQELYGRPLHEHVGKSVSWYVDRVIALLHSQIDG